MEKNVIRGKIKRDNEKKEAISQKQKQIINANTNWEGQGVTGYENI